MASAAEDIVEMITGQISPTSDALQLSEPLDKLGLELHASGRVDF